MMIKNEFKLAYEEEKPRLLKNYQFIDDFVAIIGALSCQVRAK